MEIISILLISMHLTALYTIYVIDHVVDLCIEFKLFKTFLNYQSFMVLQADFIFLW